MITSYVQTKGGTGKSTLALSTAFSRTLGKRYKRIGLVELDPQKTLFAWWKEREREGLAEKTPNGAKVSFYHISTTNREEFQKEIQKASANQDFLVMDVPGEGTGRLHTRFAMAFSDLVIIPMRTSTYDEAAFSENLYPLILDIISLAPEKKDAFQVLPTFTHPQTKKSNILNYFTEILPNEVRCMDAVYPARSVYENFNRDGLCLTEYKKMVRTNKRLRQQAEKAGNDIEEITSRILDELEKNHGRTQKNKIS